jgi:hypothetical protein
MKHAARNPNRRLAEVHIGTVLLVLFLFGLLGASIWWAIYAWTSIDVQMPTAGYVALFAGIFFSLLVGCGLMALVFYSNRKGYDEPPHLVRSGTPIPLACGHLGDAATERYFTMAATGAASTPLPPVQLR